MYKLIFEECHTNLISYKKWDNFFLFIFSTIENQTFTEKFFDDLFWNEFKVKKLLKPD